MARLGAPPLPDPDDPLVPISILGNASKAITMRGNGLLTSADASTAVNMQGSTIFTVTNSSTGAVTMVNVTLQMIPPPEVLEQPTRFSKGKKPKAWFSGDSYVCTCAKDSYLCVHIQAALLAAEEAGKHTVISKSHIGHTRKFLIPLTNEILVPFTATVRAHPVLKDDALLEVVDAEEANGVTAVLTRDDGLLLLVNKVRNWYRSTVIFDQVSTKIVNKKRLPCLHPRHGRQNDIDLVNDMKAALRSVPENLLVECDDPASMLRSVLEEVILNNTYYLIRKGMCYSCHSYTVVNPDDIPSV